MERKITRSNDERTTVQAVRYEHDDNVVTHMLKITNTCGTYTKEITRLEYLRMVETLELEHEDVKII